MPLQGAWPLQPAPQPQQPHTPETGLPLPLPLPLPAPCLRQAVQVRLQPVVRVWVLVMVRGGRVSCCCRGTPCSTTPRSAGGQACQQRVSEGRWQGQGQGAHEPTLQQHTKSACMHASQLRVSCAVCFLHRQVTCTSARTPAFMDRSRLSSWTGYLHPCLHWALLPSQSVPIAICVCCVLLC